MTPEPKRTGAPKGPRNGKPKAHVNIRTDFDIVAKFKQHAALLCPRSGQKLLFDQFVNSLPDF